MKTRHSQHSFAVRPITRSEVTTKPSRLRLIHTDIS